MRHTWQPNLEAALKDAGLDSSLAQGNQSIERLCNTIASVVMRGYLSSTISWSAADTVINHLYAAMLDCSSSPQYAWDVFLAFEEGEYHPDTPQLSDEEVTRAILESLNAPDIA